MNIGPLHLPEQMGKGPGYHEGVVIAVQADDIPARHGPADVLDGGGVDNLSSALSKSNPGP